MKKMLFAISIVLLFNAVLAAQQHLPSSTSILVNNSSVTVQQGTYRINAYPFTIRVDHITEEIPLQVFLYPTDEYFSKYRFPVNADETDMFASGTGMAAMVDEKSKAGDLYINTPGTHNYIYAGRRVNRENSAEIIVSGILDIFELLHNQKDLYLTVFADYNRNREIEENEVVNLKIEIPDN